MNPKVSIIILNWNEWGDTIECFELLYQITYPNQLMMEGGLNIGETKYRYKGEVYAVWEPNSNSLER